MSLVIPEFKTLLFEEKEPYIGIVNMNRLDKLNAINHDMLKDFKTLFHALS
jgi:enoyl-CoA hydratase/carnithine racemase